MTNQGDSTISRTVIASPETASSPSTTVGGVSVSGAAQPLRAAAYIDGFNLYHSVHALNLHYLKWLDLGALSNRLIPRGKERVILVRYFTAIKPATTPAEEAKNRRHREYITALQSYGVKVHRGHFIKDNVDCHSCGRVWPKPQEKETDVNIALHLFDDAYQDAFDVAYLLTADSDQAATARMMKERFPQKKLVTVVPPGMEASKAILSHTPHKIKIPVDYLEDCLLPHLGVRGVGQDKRVIFIRPTEYDTPPGWVAPKDRPKKPAV